ncbi:MAG: hypothetical protein A2X25_02905 [Chloroflexi bacterium GWB2_49_20]|nr:MAG: hypothetical protein A2X25_02905 [Chloroflexi bacterium GWB2_49_20]OGN78750.1 MAG: hypothetical protein A2X26_12875 [Chloroflexi bacterium GWC2_49_37]OGN85880.1 MAG: hypothetical protein A2X27_11810 [Chloroflexi bacterium GWD2_49_16]
MKISTVFLTLFTFALVGCNPISPTPDLAATIELPLRSTSTLYPSATIPSPTSTLSPFDIASAVFSDLSVEKQTFYSPDGRCAWERLQAWSIKDFARQKYDNQFFIRATVNCVRGEWNEEVNWVLVNEWKEQGLGYSIPDLLGWSADGKFLYFYDSIIPDGCQPIGGFQDNIRQVELDTGIIRSLLLGLKSGVSLSPDATRLVYYDGQKADVGSYDIVSDEVQHIPFTIPDKVDYWWVGDFTWSPDGQIVLFVIIYGDPCYPTGTSI